MKNKDLKKIINELNELYIFYMNLKKIKLKSETNYFKHNEQACHSQPNEEKAKNLH